MPFSGGWNFFIVLLKCFYHCIIPRKKSKLTFTLELVQYKISCTELFNFTFSIFLCTSNFLLKSKHTIPLHLRILNHFFLRSQVHWVPLTTSKKMQKKRLTLQSIMLMQRNLLVVAGFIYIRAKSKTKATSLGIYCIVPSCVFVL